MFRMHLAEQHLLSYVATKGDLIVKKQNCSVLHCTIYSYPTFTVKCSLVALWSFAIAWNWLITMSGCTNWILTSSFIAKVNSPETPETVTVKSCRNQLFNHPSLSQEDQVDSRLQQVLGHDAPGMLSSDFHVHWSYFSCFIISHPQLSVFDRVHALQQLGHWLHRLRKTKFSYRHFDNVSL